MHIDPKLVSLIGKNVAKFALDEHDKQKKEKEKKKKIEKEKGQAKKKADKYIKERREEEYIYNLFRFINKEEVNKGEYELDKIYKRMLNNHIYLMNCNQYKKLKATDEMSYKLTDILVRMIKKYCNNNDNQINGILNGITEIQTRTHDLKSLHLSLRNICIILENVKKDSDLSVKSFSFNIKRIKTGLNIVMDKSSSILKPYIYDGDGHEIKELLRDFVILNSIMLKAEFDSF